MTLARLKNFALSFESRPLYKYAMAEHSEQLLSTGAVRIGTLDYYRRREATDKLRGEHLEGTADFVDAPTGMHTIESLSLLTRKWFNVPPTIHMRNNTWRTRSTVSNRFMYCVSASLSHAAAGDYDSCVEIVDARGFFTEIANGFSKAMEQFAAECEVHVAPITYLNRELDARYYPHLSPAFVKPPRYSVEDEVRLVWDAPRPENIEIVDLAYQPLTKHIRTVRIPD